MNQDLSLTANLLGDPGRAAIVLSLMDGLALPAGELASIANVAPQTASGHLARLIDGGLLSVERQGRHRYYRLSSPEVADAIEALLVLTAKPKSRERTGATPTVTAGSLAHARTCYAHLAGWLGVQIAEELERRALLRVSGPKHYTVTAPGRTWFQSLGIEMPDETRTLNKLARRCLDWTERRHHLAGPLGCSMYKRLVELRWVVPIRGSRAVRVSLEGRSRLWELLRLPIG
jgi:DNA-binding transcriptional ArsR family regulator